MYLPLLILYILVAVDVIAAVDYTVTNNAPATRGGMVFSNTIGENYAKQTLDSATNFIWQIFQENNVNDRKPVNKVDLIIVSSLPPNVVAETSNNQIQFSADYLGGFSGDVKTEFTGVVYHESTHVWQWDGKGQVSQQNRGGLIEGIADYVRLKAGFIARGWAQPGDGTRWDQGYSVTARFLDYCDGLRPGFVAQLNKKMKDGYSDGFFKDLLGKSVDQLWSDYKAKYGH
ncbi:hypothetical protein vseg_018663 [Gypsophila vaccaria]